MKYKRENGDMPLAIEEWGWKYHHIGIPTSESKEGEVYLGEFGMYVTGFETSPYGIEWMRFEENSPISGLIQKVPHIAFVVENLDEALKGKTILSEPNSPSEEVRVAMIIHNGAPVELMEFTGND
ncbi:MAG: hypothetical protein JW995_08235 [Melioribacteraceae bacterium]|nr:hypothetical protein [Melioribacteraceae bacterium]